MLLRYNKIMPSFSSTSTEQLHEEAAQWFALLRSGTFSALEQKAFQQWLACSEAHRAAYRDIEVFWHELESLEDAAKPQLKEARAFIKRTQLRRRNFSRSMLALAASIVLVTAVSPFWRIVLDNGTYRTAKGEQAHIQLSDGSSIDINTDSVLRVSYSWSAREVTLMRGEALFSVTHNPDKPFQVVASKGIIRDIGTRFNVYRQGDEVSVTVLEGEVNVATQGLPKNLTQNQKVHYDAAGRLSPVIPADINQVTAWQKQQLVFKNKALSKVLEQLGRYHDTTLRVPDSRLQALKVTGVFPTNNLKLALDTIVGALSVKVVQIDNKRIEIQSKS
jgi:transmembrane sensor